MATLLNKQTKVDKSKQTTSLTTAITSTSTQTTPQWHNDVNDEVVDDVCIYDFYHIKQCYQPNKNSTRISTLNQRTNYSSIPIKTTTTITLPHALHSLSCNCRSLVTMMLMGSLLLFHYAVAAPQSCILCDKNDLLAKDPQSNYEEYLFEHQVTRQDAINALRQLNESFYEGSASDSSCNAVRCTEKVMKYCLGPQFINDHCWCEVGHSVEGLPFVPHICYVGEKHYKASAGSCFFYDEVKDCCCSSVLAKEWRHISAASAIYSKTMFHYMLVVTTFLYILIRRSYH